METLSLEAFNPTKAEVAALAESCKDIQIADVNDVEGYEKAAAARKELQKLRVSIEKTGKSARADALAFQKSVIAFEKELVDMIEPTEKRLKARIEEVDAEKLAAERAWMLPTRKMMLDEINVEYKDSDILILSEQEFAAYFNQKKLQHLEAKEAALKAQAEAQAAEQKRLDEEKKKQELEALHKIDVERQVKEAALKATLEAEAKARRDQERAAQEREAREAAEKKAAAEAALAVEREQKKLEAQKAYQAFLSLHGYSELTKDQFYTVRKDQSILLYKLAGEFKV